MAPILILTQAQTQTQIRIQIRKDLRDMQEELRFLY